MPTDEPTPSTTVARGADDAVPVSDTGRVWLPARIVLGLLVPAGAIPTFYLWLIGWIEFTGCFIACGDPDPLTGGALLTGAAILATGTLLAGWVAVSGTVRRLRRAALICAGIAVLLVIATVLVP